MSDSPENEKHTIKEKITGLGQKIIGEIESIGGILTGDPNTAAEGEFNVEVGTVREEIEEDLEEEGKKRKQGEGETGDPK
jgi:uncharacterized protein YjbJ (UPF0337 family)